MRLDIESTKNLLIRVQPLFDIVRIVDPVTMTVYSIDDDNKLVPQPAHCYEVWDKSERCDFCTGNIGLAFSSTANKNETDSKNEYSVVTKPITIIEKDGAERVMDIELVSASIQETQTSRNAVLIVDDNSINRLILQRIVETSYLVIQASNGAEALEILKDNNSRIAAVILDLAMPIMDGRETLKAMKSNPFYNNIPVLVATGDDAKASEKECLELGAWDFVKKPYDKEILMHRLKNIIARSMANETARIKYLAERDVLTGLFNRGKFFENTRMLLKEHYDDGLALLRFDVDQFGLFNTFFGEQKGDNVLRYIAELVQSEAKKMPYCTYGRIESDVFAMCIPFSEERVNNFCLSVRNLLTAHYPNYYLKPSFGIYKITDQQLSVENMYMNATLASRKCKNSYSTSIAYYDTEMSNSIRLNQEIMNDAQSGIDNEEFLIYLQPKYDLKTETPCGAEALVRWQHPTKGMISPGQFIPVFESNGFVSKLDYYIWEKTCKQIKEWLDEGKEVLPISVNISRVDAYNPNLPLIFERLTEQYNVPHHLLNLEITESAYMDNPDQIRKTVEKLQSKGFILLMDDFGSGYSSLNTLKDIPVDILKIDMKFLPTGENNERSEKILASVIRMSGWLGIPVVVEGVETKNQKDFLSSIACGYVQGYYFSKPMPVKDYEKLVENFSTMGHEHISFSESDEKDSIIHLLWSSKEDIQKLLDSIAYPVAFFEHTANNIDILRVNSQYLKVYSNDDGAINTSLEKERISPDDIENIKDCFKQASDGKDMAQCVYSRVDNEGKVTWTRLYVKYVQSYGNKNILMATFNDISNEKQLEIEMNRLMRTVYENTAQREKILIVDDMEISRVALKEIFYDKYDIVFAENGYEALTQLKNEDDISLILLDLFMPEMDGWQFLKEKNKNSQWMGIPVIVISSENKETVQENIIQIGVEDYITKPFVPVVVLRRVGNVLEHRRRLKDLIKNNKI